jgi:flagellar biosynthetic protein FliR
MTLALDANWMAGLLFAMTRVAGFVAASPFFPRSVPMVARAAVIVTLGFFLAAPVGNGTDLLALLSGGVMNAAVGITLGFLTGLMFQLFAVAGGLVDFSAGLTAGAVFDPALGAQSTVFERMFSLTALTMFYVLGGLGLVATGLAGSVRAIALDGSIAPDGRLAEMTVEALSRFLAVGLEISMPAVAALFLIEIVLALASRFAPQANVFLLGMPLKILVALGTLGVVTMIFPDAVDGLVAAVRDGFTDGLVALMGRP